MKKWERANDVISNGDRTNLEDSEDNAILPMESTK